MHAPVRRLAAAGALLVSLAPPVTAAPLDALLDLQTHPDAPTRWQLELDRDLANERLDVFGWRSQAGSQVGNYAGQHLRIGMQSGRWSSELLYWRRAIADTGRTHQLATWQAAAQYEFGQPSDPQRWGLRLSGWQDQASQLTRRTSAPLVAQGIDAKLSELQLVRPRDRQWQLDLLGRSALPIFGVHGLAVTGFAGAGRSLVTRSSANASARIAGCDYQIDFGAERLTASPPDGCNNAPIISVPNALLPFDAWQETGYRASFVHLGGALRWQSDDWRLALGLELQQWRREGVDERLRQRGGTPYTSNQTLIGEVQYRVTPALSAVLRGQVMRHQFLGELPLIYNGLTASRFGHRYGLVSAGLVCDFGL